MSSFRRAHALTRDLRGLRTKQLRNIWCIKAVTNLRRKYRKWREARKLFFKSTWELLQTIEKDEEYDLETVDEDGNPVKNERFVPRFVRMRWRFFILVYYQPCLQMLDKLPSIWRLLRLILLLAPSSVFMAALAWLGVSVYKNLEYTVGDCAVDEMPETFTTSGNLDQTVSGVYAVKRFYEPTDERLAGYVVQTCVVTVDCEQIDDEITDRCVEFRLWTWGEAIACFYHKSDYHGDLGRQLYCLSRPSKLEREFFTVCVAGVVLFITCCAQVIWFYRKVEERRQREAERRDDLARQQEVQEARRIIEEREVEESRKMAAAAERAEEGNEKDDPAEDLAGEQTANSARSSIPSSQAPSARSARSAR